MAQMVTLAELDRCDPHDWDRLYKKWFTDRQLSCWIYNLEPIMEYIERLETLVHQGGIYR